MKTMVEIPKTIKRWAILGMLADNQYLATWHMADLLGINRGDFGGPGCSHSGDWFEAVRELESEGLIRELPDLRCRYELVKN